MTYQEIESRLNVPLDVFFDLYFCDVETIWIKLDDGEIVEADFYGTYRHEVTGIIFIETSYKEVPMYEFGETWALKKEQFKW